MVVRVPPRRLSRVPCGIWLLPLWLLFSCSWLAAASSTFTIATYNLENYRIQASESRPTKHLESRRKLHEILASVRADVLALQELGSRLALLDLRANLRSLGLEYPHWEFVEGFDTNVHLAILSRFPIHARRPHTKEGFLLHGRRFRVSRGFAEVEIGISDRYRLTLLNAHLKSKRPVGYADEADLREEEARLLREIVDDRLRADPDLNLAVVGDLNDFKDSRPIRMLMGRGRLKLHDTRPAERNGDSGWVPRPGYEPRTITWTHFFGQEDTYSRIDYILISAGLAREWEPQGTHIPTFPDWGMASDHRLIVAQFHAEDR